MAPEAISVVLDVTYIYIYLALSSMSHQDQSSCHMVVTTEINVNGMDT